MAAVTGTGFDSYSAAQFLAFWSGTDGTITFNGPGRFGYGQYAVVTSTGSNNFANYKTLPATQTTVTVGDAINCAGTNPTNTLIGFLDASLAVLGYVHVLSNGAIAYNNGSADVAVSAAGLITAKNWAYVECEVILSHTSGTVTINIENVLAVTQTGVITAANTNPCSAVSIAAGNTSQCWHDDWYVTNTSGGVHTGFLGPQKALSLMPAGAGRITQLSEFPATGFNWQKVNEIPPDGDTTYVYSSTVGNADAYTLTTFANVSAVTFVQQTAYARKDNTSTRSIEIGWGNGSTEVYGSGQALTTSYVYYANVLDVNPITTVAWAVSDFTTGQAAIKVSA